MNVNLTCPFCGQLCNMKKDEYVKPRGTRSARQYFHADCFLKDQKDNLQKIRRVDHEQSK